MPTEKSLVDFTIGADPEFICIAGATDVVRASDIVDDPESGSIGADGNGIIFEARPEPSKDPLQVVSNIHRIFMTHVFDKPEFTDYKWVAGSYAFNNSLGGHIHFGIKNQDIKECSYSLSQYVGSLSLLIENKQEALRRRAHSSSGYYGGMMDFREQNYGFEYRTPSSWLTSPYVAAAILCLAKTVLFEKINNPDSVNLKLFVVEDFINVNTDKVRALFPDIWSEITKMALYQTYKPHIDVLYYLIKNKMNWFPKTSLKEAWGIMDVTSEYPKTQITLGSIWSRFNQTTSQAVA